MRIFAIVFLLQFSGFNAFPQWIQSSGLTGARVIDIDILDTTLFIVTPDGKGIYRKEINETDWENCYNSLVYTEQVKASDTAVFAVADNGFFRSFNLGDTWEDIGPNMWSFVSTFAIMEDHLFVAESNSIYYSADQGDSYAGIMLPGNSLNAPYVWANNELVYVANHSHPEMIYESTDNGASWDSIQFTTVPMSSEELWHVLNFQDKVWAAGIGGVYIWDGNVWSAENSGFPENPICGELKLINGILYSITSEENFSFNSGECYYFNGTNWVSISAGLMGEGVYSLCSYNNIFFCGHETGPYKKTSGGNWEPIFDGLNFLDVFDLGRTGDTLFACTGSGLYRSDDFGQSFQRQNIGDIMKCHQLIITDSIYYLRSMFDGFAISLDQGQSWDKFNSGLPLGRPYLGMGVNAENIFLLGDEGLFKCAHGNYSWELLNDSMFGGNNQSLLVNDTEILAQVTNDVYLSQNNGDDFIIVHDSVTRLHFIEGTYYAFYHNSSNHTDFIHYSSDGVLWNKKPIEYSGRSIDVRDNTILLGGIKPIIHNDLSLSLDYGQTWYGIMDNLAHSFDYGGFNYVKFYDQRSFVSHSNASLWHRDDLLTDIYEEPYSKQELFLYPNPARDKLTVELPDDIVHDIQVRVFDVFGRSHNVSGSSISDNSIQISTANLPPTIYLINILVDNQSYTAKFIKN